jgi:hypothetical protein
VVELCNGAVNAWSKAKIVCVDDEAGRHEINDRIDAHE